MSQFIENTVENCLLYHLLEYEEEVTASREYTRNLNETLR